MATPERIGFRLDGIEPASDPAWHLGGAKAHAAFWAKVAEVGVPIRRRSLGKGLDKDGQPLAAIAASTRKARKRPGYSPQGKASPYAPPLTPCYGLSRTRCLLRATALSNGVWFDWGYDRHTRKSWGVILDYHRKGGHGKVRDVIGMPPADKVAIQALVNTWWAKNRVKFAQVEATATMKSDVAVRLATGNDGRASEAMRAHFSDPTRFGRVSAGSVVHLDVLGRPGDMEDLKSRVIFDVRPKRGGTGAAPVKPIPITATPLLKPAAKPRSRPQPAAAKGHEDKPPGNRALRHIARAVETIQADGILVDRAANAELAKTHSRARLAKIVMAYDRERKVVQVNERHDVWDDPGKRMRRLYREGVYSGDDRDHLVWHEIGHAKHDEVQPNLYLLLLGRGWATSEQREIAARVSQRAALNPVEFVAEVYAALRGGRTFDDAEVSALYDDLGGPR